MLLQGIVQKGKQRGKDLGFPTANIPLTETVDDGIYLSYTFVDGKKYESLAFIGIAETFGDTKRYAESYILDFDKSIYNKEISIELLKKLRENQKFDTVEALVKQMNDDAVKAKEFFTKFQKNKHQITNKS